MAPATEAEALGGWALVAFGGKKGKIGFRRIYGNKKPGTGA
jgi:hypothetical protein